MKTQEMSVDIREREEECRVAGERLAAQTH